MDTRYITVDLLIESILNLALLLDYFKDKAIIVSNEISDSMSFICLESNIFNSSGPEEDILYLLTLIDAMPPYLHNLWHNSCNKVMDIGYECGNTDVTIDTAIGLSTLQRVVLSGCAINIRIYPYIGRPEDDDIIVVKD